MSSSVRFRATTVALLVASGACSLRSLDHLAGDETGAAASTGMGGAPTGGSAGAAVAGGAGGAGTGGSGGASGSGGAGGSAGATPGTAGAPASGGSGGSGGAVSSAGGAGGVELGEAGSDDGGGGEGAGPPCTTGDVGCPPPPAEEIPYVLRPAHAPQKCADISLFGPDDAAPAIQYQCFQQINQVFWAEDHGGGIIALRNAQSGKCLEVAAASEQPGAPIEQWSCNGSASQLFLPIPSGDGVVTLVAQHSGLALDVSGAATPDDFAPIVQSPIDASLDMAWELQRSELGAFLVLAADEEGTLFLRHDGQQVLMEESAEGSSEWKVVSGLGNPQCVSLASRDDTSRYLRHDGVDLSREASDGSEGFARDATFCSRTAFAATSYLSRTFEAESRPGHYLTRSEGRVIVAAFEDTEAFRAAATWTVGQLW